MGEARAEPNTRSQDQGLGEEAPPFDPPSFPSLPQQQIQLQGQPEVPTHGLIIPPPGGLTKSPEELTRQISWTALTEAVTKSAVALYPDDPQAVTLTVANSLQPYMTAFAPHSRIGFPTVGTPSDVHRTSTPLSKTTEIIVLGAIAGNKSHEVAKYQHTFPTFPGDKCRDDVELWAKCREIVYGFKKLFVVPMTSWHE